MTTTNASIVETALTTLCAVATVIALALTVVCVAVPGGLAQYDDGGASNLHCDRR